MTSAELRTTQVDLTGLMRVLGEHLYSTPLVALRELVQNAHDACVRRRVEAPSDAATPWIRVRVDPAHGLLTVEDSGAGLTRDEIVDYLATVGAGYTRLLRGTTQRDDLIGYFGLGFLSAFVVSERVSVRTTSYQSPDLGWHYQSRGGERFTLEECNPRQVGSIVELALKDKFRVLLTPETIRAVLVRYCALLPLPVFVGDGTDAVNAEPPPWRGPSETNALVLHRKRLAFATRFGRRFEPICTIELAPSGASDARGLLWIHDGLSYGTSDNREVAVFTRGMLLDDDARDLLPPWAGFVGGVLESSKLTPTASREDLQRDDAWNAVTAALVEALVTGMATLARREPEAWRRVLMRHNEALLGAALCDARLFSLLADELTVPTTEGDLPVKSVLERSKQKVHVSLSARGGFEEMVFRALKVPIAAGTRYGVLAFAKHYCEARGGVVVELGTADGNSHVFRPATVDEPTRAFLAEHLAGPDQRIVPARFAPAELPLVLVPDREVELKRRVESDEADKRIASAALGLARLYTAKVTRSTTADLYVNLDCPAIARILASRDQPEGARRATRLLRAVAALMTGADGAASNVDLRAALADVGESVLALLGDGPPTSAP